MSSTGFLCFPAPTAAVCRKHYGAIVDELQRRLFTEERTSVTAEDFTSVVENLMAEVGTKPAKAKKEKAPKGPSKREQNRQAALKQLAELDAEKAVELADAKTAEIKKAIKAINKANAPPKVKKAAAKAQYPKSEYTHRPLKVNKEFILGKNGAKLRVAIHKETRKVYRLVEDNWSEEATAQLTSVFTEKDGELYDLKAKKAKATKVAKEPKAKKEKKVKKAKAKAPADEEKQDDKPSKSQQDLIASLVAEASAPVLAAPAVETSDENKPAPTVEAVTQQYAQMKVNDEQVEQELEEEESDDEEELQELSGSDSEDEIEYDEDDVEEFSHSSRPGEKLFIDGEYHVWDEDQELVGTYNSATDTIF
tara:strand:+ start:236 stop:1330 length:1095 start_codon:yes stop_codon:yes gene_type:complete